MTGLERNADVVHMASYAPLFAHAEGWQWTPDLIWFDNLRAYGTPNYYVQKLFANHRGTHVLPMTTNSHAVKGEQGIFGSAVRDEGTREIILKLVNTNTRPEKLEIEFKGNARFNTTAHQSLIAARNNDFRKVAALTAEAKRLNDQLSKDPKNVH